MNFSYLLRTVAIAVATFTTFSPSANALEVGTLSKAVQAEEARLGARIGMAENGGGYIGRDAAAIVISILEK